MSKTTRIDWMDDRGISPDQLDAVIAACELEMDRFDRDLFKIPDGKFIEYLDLCYILPEVVRYALRATRAPEGSVLGELQMLKGKAMQMGTDGPRMCDIDEAIERHLSTPPPRPTATGGIVTEATVRGWIEEAEGLPDGKDVTELLESKLALIERAGEEGEWKRVGDELPPLGECVQFCFIDEGTGDWETHVENVLSHERPDDWYWRVIDAPPFPPTTENSHE